MVFHALSILKTAMYINPLTAIDFYKADHRSQYPNGTTEVYSNLTPRSSRLANVFDDFDHPWMCVSVPVYTGV